MSDVTSSENAFLRQLFSVLGLPLNATPVALTADVALPANTWVKVNTLNVSAPPTHDSVPIVDPIAPGFIDQTGPGGPNLSGAGYQVVVIGTASINAAAAGTLFVTFDQSGFGDMCSVPIAAGATVSVPIILNGSTQPTGSNPSLWVRSTTAATLKASSPIVDHTGGSAFGTRFTVITFPIAH